VPAQQHHPHPLVPTFTVQAYNFLTVEKQKVFIS
jgi:hypothetical protein